jgi:hypothetical protein
MTARTDGSELACPSRAISASLNSTVQALRVSGRLNVMVATPASTS